MSNGEFEDAMAPFAPFERAPKIAVAVSGGADSTCLAVLARSWTEARGGELRAFVVDHGLRADAAVEAGAVASGLAGSGIAAEVLRWEHPPIERAIQRQARDARYALLDAAIGRWEGLHLLTAHHADDQAETVAMRAAQGSGPLGLSGMPAVTERAQLRVLRPLLGFPKERLVATLVSRAIDWVEDPSNLDERFMRARLRRMNPMPTPGFCGPAARLALDAAAARFLAEHGWLADDRRVRIDRARFRLLDPSVGRHLLGRILAALAGRFYAPPASGLARLHAALCSGRPGGMTLGGCIVRFGDRWVRLHPEAALPGPWRPPVAVAPAPLGTAGSSCCDLASLAK